MDVAAEFLLLVIGIVATAVGSGSLFDLCRFLCRWMMEIYRRRHAHQPPPAPTPDVEAGESPPAQADVLVRNVRNMSPVNGVEPAAVTNHVPNAVAVNRSIPSHEDGGLPGYNEATAYHHLQINAGEVPCSARQPLSTDANASGVGMEIMSLSVGNDSASLLAEAV
ncbi:hypothetical protein KC19_3G144300 [Ceratodon purpureus]|uniref:Uncharacterized protein n=1 Tax=Ceratodon purpureus TaxID=3225 RepID=A0A8T0IKQ6_CERPU|nr:hypothetical protein KC19_3G144300 [Ceratodon purpureus]